MKKALFLDRDGVINVDHGYVYQPEKFEFIDGVFDACLAFQNAGYEIIVVTNQSGIGRGYYTEQDFHHLTKWMVKQFNQHGVNILDVYFSPYHPSKAKPEYLKDSDCRKPKPGMLLQAIAEHGLDPKSSVMVGDKLSDMQAAIGANIGQQYLVNTGQKPQSDPEFKDFDSLLEIAEFVLK